MKSINIQPDPATWQSLGKLWVWASSQPWWEDFLNVIADEINALPDIPHPIALSHYYYFINPKKFPVRLVMYMVDTGKMEKEG